MEPSTARGARVVDDVDVLAIVIGLGGVLGTWYHARGPIGVYDEGLLLTNATLLLRGQWPYLDFYTQYPPGTILVLAGAFAALGPTVAVERAIGVALRAAAVFVAGRIAGRLSDRPFSFPAAGLVALWWALLPVPPWAYTNAVLMGLVAVGAGLALVDAPTRGRAVAAGVAFGAVSFLRHDLFVYTAIALVGMAAWLLVVLRGRIERSVLLRCGEVALAAFVTTAVLWAPFVLAAGPSQVLWDIYFVQLQIKPARDLPMPDLIGWPPPPLLWPFPGAVALVLVGPLFALAFATIGVLWRSEAPDPAATKRVVGFSLLAAFAAGSVPQMAGRTDLVHAVYGTVPALVCLGAAIDRVPVRLAWARVPLLLLLAFPARSAVNEVTWGSHVVPMRHQPRASGLPVDHGKARRQVLDIIKRETRPGDPIFVGLRDHRYAFVSDMDLYFLADRTGGVRVMQFDPNATNWEGGQREMIDDLEASRARIAVLVDQAPPTEPNEAANAGSDLLDRYIASKYVEIHRAAPYTVMRRLPDPEAR